MRKGMIMGAGGTDIHNSYTAYRNDPATEVFARLGSGRPMQMRGS